MRLEEAVEGYFKEWLAGFPPKDATGEWYQARMKEPYAILESGTKLFDIVTPKANRLLSLAAELLLERAGEQRRVQRKTARRCILQAQEAHLDKAVKRGRWSEHAIIAGALKRVADTPRANGTYAIPVAFAPAAKATKLRIGPARMLSRIMFEQEYGDAISRSAASEDWFGPEAVEEWRTYSERYDHFIVIDVKNHETEMAWAAAREVADYVLNLARIGFGFYHMDDVRIGNGFIWEQQQAQVYFSDNGEANFSLSSGPWASHLEDGWADHLLNSLGPRMNMLGSLAAWMTSGDDARSPVLERLRYANNLIAEAYSEPHDRIRLVRLVASLEALAALPREDKSDVLSWRCAYAGGWSDPASAVQIIDDVMQAYQIRNAIVHGDPTDSEKVRTAFYRLERNIGQIYLGFLSFYAKIQRRYRPQHIRHIRRAFSKHIEFFFWNPEEVW